MGFLDNLNLDDPKTQLLLQMGLGLLGGAPGQRKNFGADFAHAGQQGLLSYAGAQKTQRENRTSDLAQVGGAYNLLKQQEFQRYARAEQAGEPYTPNPLLAQMEARMSQLTTLPNLSGQGGASPSAAPVPAAPAPTPQTAPALPAATASQYSPVVRPEYQAQGPMPQPQPRAQSKTSLGGPAGGLPMAAWLAQDPTGATYMKQLAEDNKPLVLREGDLVRKGPDGSYTSAYQQPKMEAGVLPQRNAAGQVVGAGEIPNYARSVANIKATEVGATEGAKAPFNFGTYNTGPGGGPQIMSIQKLMRMEGGGPQQPQSPAQPPRVASLEVTEPSRAPGPGGGLAGPNPISTEAQNVANRDFVANEYRPVVDQMGRNRQVRAQLDVMDKLPIAAKTGWSTGTKAMAASVLSGLFPGLTPDAAKEYAADAQVFESMKGARVWELLAAQKGVQTEGDAHRAGKVFAGLQGRPEANQFMNDMARSLMNIQDKQARFYQLNLPKHTKEGDLTRLSSAWAEKAPSIWDDPVMKKWDQSMTDRRAPPSNGPSLDEVNAEIRRREAAQQR